MYDESDDKITSFILRDLVPAGLFVGRRHPDRSVEILLDYVSPQYRDFKIGRYLFSKAAGLFFDPTSSNSGSKPPTTTTSITSTR